MKYDPFPLVFGRGDEPTQLVCLHFFGMHDSPRGRHCQLQLISKQRPDGSFPSGFDRESWGMQETVRNTLLLMKVGLSPGGINVNSAVQFILHHQNPDGGWCENRALKLPPERTWLSNERSITWLTADVIELLRQVGWGEGTESQIAVTWLRSMQNECGAWPSLATDRKEQGDARGDPDATVQIGFLMGDIFGQDDLAHLRAKRLFEAYLDECAQDVARGYRVRLVDGEREELDVYHLTHLLLSWLLDPPRRFQRGYDMSDPRVKRMMAALVDSQQKDGGWRPFFAQEASPVYTLLAVKVLVLSGALKQEELVDAVKAYAA